MEKIDAIMLSATLPTRNLLDRSRRRFSYFFFSSSERQNSWYPLQVLTRGTQVFSFYFPDFILSHTRGRLCRRGPRPFNSPCAERLFFLFLSEPNLILA